MKHFHARPGGRVSGSLTVPGDKSISHRAVMLAAIAEGRSTIHGFLESADCMATLKAFQDMGVTSTRAGQTWVIEGVGLLGLQAADHMLDVGNAGTAMRLLAGLLAGQAFDSQLTGDASLRRRPMRRVTEPLRKMGAQITADAGDTAPLRIRGSARLRGIRYPLPIPSAQVKSCVLLAGLYAQGETCVVESAPSRDHTERMFETLGIRLAREQGELRLQPGQRLTGAELTVPGDFSSAAFFLVAAAIQPGCELRIERVGMNPTRTGAFDVLRAMGADIQVENSRMQGAEPVADLRVRGGELRGTEIDPAWVPLAIDEFPVLFIAAACARGETLLRGAAELRVKESDRIAVMAQGLSALGVFCEVLSDGIRIQGGPISGGEVDSHGDHRVAMAFAVAGLAADGPVSIRDCDNVDTSFPGFVDTARSVGIDVEESDHEQ